MIDGQPVPGVGGDLPVEENHELTAELAALAGKMEQPIMLDPVHPVQSVNLTQVDEIAGVLFTVGALLSMRFKSLAKIYTQARCAETAAAVEPVFERLGWNISGGEFGIYITAGASVLMLGYETREAIQADLLTESKNEQDVTVEHAND